MSDSQWLGRAREALDALGQPRDCDTTTGPGTPHAPARTWCWSHNAEAGGLACKAVWGLAHWLRVESKGWEQ